MITEIIRFLCSQKFDAFVLHINTPIWHTCYQIACVHLNNVCDSTDILNTLFLYYQKFDIIERILNKPTSNEDRILHYLLHNMSCSFYAEIWKRNKIVFSWILIFTERWWGITIVLHYFTIGLLFSFYPQVKKKLKTVIIQLRLWKHLC